jgi:hypothetical protein
MLVSVIYQPSPRRFPPSRTIEELNDACFVVSDAYGQKLAYVYFEDEQDGERRPSCSPKTRLEGLPTYRQAAGVLGGCNDGQNSAVRFAVSDGHCLCRLHLWDVSRI